MVFSSIDFLFKFLPIFFVIFMFCPKAWKNLCLFAGSLLFYLYGVKDTPWYLALFLVSIIVNYRMSFWIDGSLEPVQKKRRLAAGVIFNLSILAVFKYTHRLPLGISFYTFQAVGWLIDVYREGRMQGANFVKFGTFMTLFPHVISGPILRWKDTSRDLSRQNRGLDALENGLRELTIGLGMKVLLANQMADLWEKIRAVGYESISTPLAWLGIVAFSFEIYFDFYGYSLMAIGLGEMFGFHLPKNFQYPYMATSMTDFWRRWHMTLGSWFRDYVYIPLGGSRCSKGKMIRNLLVVWLLTGLWHGAGWNFLLWGFLLFVLVTVEKLCLLKVFRRVPILGRVYMILAIPLSWLIFAISDPGQIWIYVQRLFPFLAAAGRFSWFAGDYLKYGKMYLTTLLAGMILITPLPRKLYERYKGSMWSALVLILIFWFSVYCIWIGQDDPFMYFAF